MKDGFRFCGYIFMAIAGIMVSNEAMDGMFRILAVRRAEQQANRLWKESMVTTAPKANGASTGG